MGLHVQKMITKGCEVCRVTMNVYRKYVFSTTSIEQICLFRHLTMLHIIVFIIKFGSMNSVREYCWF